MNALAFAWRSLVRQPARAALGVLGVAAVGALLFDMLMLSDGLVVSMRDLLERTGFDVRVSASEDLGRGGERIPDASPLLLTIAALPEVRSALALRFVDADVSASPREASDGAEAGRAGAAGEPASEPAGGRDVRIPSSLQGVGGGPPWPWTLLRGRDPQRDGEVVVSEPLAAAAGTTVGGRIVLHARCRSRADVLPGLPVQVVGIAEFPFETAGEHTAAGSMRTVHAACGDAADEADILVVGAAADAGATANALRAVRPDLTVATNDQVVGRLERNGFTYFRQISAVLTTVTLSFAALLITVLLTVSVNQRLGEIAALRALGLSRGRVVADVLCESALIVGFGGLLSLPLGVLLAQLLDGILTSMPGIPAEMHFFVFEPRTLALHTTLLALTAVVAALYPMRLVATLPIAATLRAEVLS